MIIKIFTLFEKTNAKLQQIVERYLVHAFLTQTQQCRRSRKLQWYFRGYLKNMLHEMSLGLYLLFETLFSMLLEVKLFVRKQDKASKDTSVLIYLKF